MGDHVIQGRAIVPGAGWLALMAHESGVAKLADVAFMRGVFEPDTTIRVVKRRRLMQASAGDEIILKASAVAGAPAPETIGPDAFGRGVPIGGTQGVTKTTKGARGKENGVANSNGVGNGNGAASVEGPILFKNVDGGANVTDDSSRDQHYRRCSALRLEYTGAYRAIERVTWSGHVFKAE
jgi:hypothetical protein